jgi:hypothetical protein
MTSMFSVRVMNRTDTDVVFRVRIMSTEQPSFCASRSFGLMLLYDPIAQGLASDAPLASEMSFDDTLDANWVTANIARFIKSTCITHVEHLPLTVDPAEMSPGERRRFWRSSKAPTASLEVTASGPAWVSHLRKGMEWETGAFDLIPD